MNWTLDEERRARTSERMREYRKANKDAIAAYQREYRAANREALDEYQQAYRDANEEALAAKRREYKQTNKEWISEKGREYRAANKEAIVEYRRRYFTTPSGRYTQHRLGAKKRGIPFLLTFDEWWGVWEPHWHMRDGTGNLHMCRTNDEGGYELGNVRIDTKSNNTRERWGTL